MKNELFIFSAIVLFSLVCSFASANIDINENDINVSGTHNAAYSGSFNAKNADIASNITNVSCSASGAVGGWVSFASCPSVIAKNSTSAFAFNVNIPKYTAPGNYTGTINVSGLLNGNPSGDIANINVAVSGSAGIAVVWLKEPANILQGKSQSIEFNITNTGNVLLPVNYTVISADLINFNETFSLAGGEGRKSNISINTSSSTRIGSHTIKLSVSGINASEARAELEKSFNVLYSYCSSSANDSISIESIINDDDLEDMELKPLDSFNVEVRVRNRYNERRYAVVEAALVYDNSVVDKTKAKERLKISSGDTEEVTLRISVPANIKDGIHYLYVKAYDDENSDNCQQREIKMDVVKEDYSVLPFNVVFSEDIECGKEFSASGKIINIGANDEDKVKISYLDDLGNKNEKVINDMSEGESSSFSFIFNIPKDAKNGTHSATLRTYFDYDDISGRYEREKSNVYSYVIEGACYTEIKKVSVSLQPTAYLGKEMDISLDVKNSGNVNSTYSIEASASWAEINKVEPNTFSLNAGESKTVVISMAPKDGTSLGIHSVDVKINYDGKTETIPVSVNVAKSQNKGFSITGDWLNLGKIGEKISSGWTWIVIDAVLLMAIISFVIFFLLKPRAKFNTEIKN